MYLKDDLAAYAGSTNDNIHTDSYEKEKANGGCVKDGPSREFRSRQDTSRTR